MNSRPVLLALALFALAPVYAATPSFGYQLLSSPLSVTRPEQCRSLAEQFSFEISKLSAEHDACLQGAPNDGSISTGTCSKPACQAFHSARDDASARSSIEVGNCQKRLSNYMAEQRVRQARDAEAKSQEMARDAAREQRNLEADQRYLAQKKGKTFAAVQSAPVPSPKAASPQSEDYSARQTNSSAAVPHFPTRAAAERPIGSTQRALDTRLSREQLQTLRDTGVALVATYMAELSIKSIRAAVGRAAGAAKTNPILEYSEPFLDTENYRNIQETVASQIRQRSFGSVNSIESRQLDELERQEKSLYQPK